jgi:hypothetical protein
MTEEVRLLNFQKDERSLRIEKKKEFETKRDITKIFSLRGHEAAPVLIVYGQSGHNLPSLVSETAVRVTRMGY